MNSSNSSQSRIAWFSSAAGKSGRFTELISPYFNNSVLFSDCGTLGEHYLQAFTLHRKNPFENSLFCLEDDARSAFVQTALRSFPGLTFFLDSNFNRLEFSKLAFSSNGILLDERLEECFGGKSIKLGDFQARGWSIDVFDHFYPQGQDELKLAPIALFSSGKGQSIFNRRSSNSIKGQKVYFPLQAPRENQLSENRAKLKKYVQSSAKPIVSYAGEFVLEDRAETVLEVCSKLKDKLEFVYISRPGVGEGVRSLMIEAGQEIIETNNDQEFASYVQGSDIHLAPRLDKLRGQSLGFYRALEAGCAVVALDYGEARDYPSSVVCRITSGPEEERELHSLLSELGNSTSLLGSLKTNISKFIEHSASPEIVANEIAKVLKLNKLLLDSALAAEVEATNKEVESLVSSVGSLKKDSLYDDLSSSSGDAVSESIRELLRR